MKGIIVVDIPKSCRECELRTASGYCLPTHKDIFRYGLIEERANWCPIRLLPEKSDVTPISDNSYLSGWNDCLDAIVKEK